MLIKLNVRRISTRLSLGAALALLVTAANANTFTIDATWVDGPGTITGSFTMNLGDWSTIANVNVQATLPYTGSNAYGQLVTITDHLTFNSASFVPNAPNSDAGYIWLTNTSKPAASYHIALGVTPLPNQQVIMDYNIGTYGAGHPSEVQDLTHLWDYFQGTVTDPVTAAPIVAGVPEPSTWVMMLIGFLGLGAAAKRFRRNVSFA
jgi:PEP-CTERM motif-containing protein